ncbi:MAG: pyrroline-5-carboxylate reductase [Planctomycetota bacterium]
MLDQNILLIGGGNMGCALLRGILSAKLTEARRVTVADVDASRLEVLKSDFGVETTTDANSVIADQDTVILAVKPFTLIPVLEHIRDNTRPETLFLSIIAGVEGAVIRDSIGKNNPVIRCMPNLPATVDAAASAYAPCEPADDGHIATAEAIFSSCGVAARVAESQIDAVTGLSGSGPAYIFLVIEALCDGGVQMGLPRDVAKSLATQTVLGAAKLVQESGEHPGVLKDQVTTPGGTTIAGIRALEDRGLRATMMAAVEAATEQSRLLKEQAAKKS